MKRNLIPPPDRGLCIRCLRADSVCLCHAIQPFSPNFQIILLQHPKERKNTIGTARLTHLCIANSKLIPGIEFDHDPAVNSILDDPKNFCVTLFPGERSVNVSENASDIFGYQAGDSRTLTVFVIDGTWSQARGMLRKSTKLGALPQIRFTPTTPSNYRVRKQPNRLCLSTIEAVHQLVKALDPKKNPDILVELFAQMIDHQIHRATTDGKLREISLGMGTRDQKAALTTP